MKIQCDVCHAPATIICCADEAALCAGCDVEIHAANKLASKHQRLLLECLSDKLPRCDICKEKAAFIFCVEDRALFCRDCDEPIHIAGTLSGDHQRYLATGIRVALSTMANSTETQKSNPEPPGQSPPAIVAEVPPTQQATQPFMHPAWAVDDFLQLSDYESTDKKGSPIGFGELDWFSDVGLFNDQLSPSTLAAAEVPELRTSQASNASYHRSSKTSQPYKKPRFDVSDDDEYFIVPDLG